MEPQHKHNSSTLNHFVLVSTYSFLEEQLSYGFRFSLVGVGRPDEHCHTKGERVHCKDLVKARMNLAAPQCTTKCRSREHAEDVVAAVTRGSEGQLRLFLSLHCHNAATLRDHFGRTALHMAASMGKKTLLEWLLEMKNSDLTAKDKESGWTALHRSAFYGQIHCLIPLVKVCL